MFGGVHTGECPLFPVCQFSSGRVPGTPVSEYNRESNLTRHIAMKKFEIQSDYQPAGDQPEAIRQLVEGVRRGDRFQTLLGVTGSGKTFTVSQMIQELQRPTLVISH